ncbi:Hypothetical predicted protein [Podarcis lilfordi]|uniref:Uncharacterized protein n=1 Tax=Podarcis lilfordi TaxID=74358 RepID=A0AA35KA89_9SAUR|nr:Hypothetical predicted protein [Podarcis lilfordi]
MAWLMKVDNIWHREDNNCNLYEGAGSENSINGLLDSNVVSPLTYKINEASRYRLSDVEDKEQGKAISFVPGL